ncbi:MAG: hypothetical protein AB7P20_24095 [Rhizobiaceae bacterium]
MSGLSNATLWKRIQDYQFDKVEAELTFTQRLARENGWELDFASRAVDEYRRFIYLTSIAKEMLTPSEEVDQVWHLHLVYTRDYWQRFCKETLRRDLHHAPTEGGPAEQEKFLEAYRRTLALYHDEFGGTPPADIWPDEATRFRPIGQRRSVDTSEMIILPRWLVGRALGLALSALIGIGGVLTYISGHRDFGIVMMAIAFFTLIGTFAQKANASGKKDGSGGGCGGSGSGCGGGCGGGCG